MVKHLTIAILLAVASKVVCTEEDENGCEFYHQDNVTSFCKINNLDDLKRYIPIPRNITKL